MFYKNKLKKGSPSLKKQSIIPTVSSQSSGSQHSRTSSNRRQSYLKAVNNPVPVPPDYYDSSSGFCSLSDLPSSQSQTDSPQTATDPIEKRMNTDDILRLINESSVSSEESEGGHLLFRPQDPAEESFNSLDNNAGSSTSVNASSRNQDDRFIDDSDSDNESDFDPRLLRNRYGSLSTRPGRRILTRHDASRGLRAMSMRSVKSVWQRENTEPIETVFGWQQDRRYPYGCVKSVVGQKQQLSFNSMSTMSKSGLHGQHETSTDCRPKSVAHIKHQYFV